MNEHEIKGTAKEWEGKVTGTIKQAEGKVEKEYGRLKEETQDILEEFSDPITESTSIGERAGQAWDEVMDFVQVKPGQAVGYSLLTGMVLGALLGYVFQDN